MGNKLTRIGLIGIGNDFLNNGTFNASNGELTLNVSSQPDVIIDLDGRYLESFTETDPIFIASVASGINAGDITNWDTAFGWGDHSGLYDNYQSWNLKTNGIQRTTVQSGGDLDIVAGTNMTVSYSAGGVVTLNANAASGGQVNTLVAGLGIDVDNADPVNPIVSAEGLKRIDETNGDGWRLLDFPDANYGNIGLRAVDFSYSVGTSSTRGATGEGSFAIGIETTVSGKGSFGGGNTSVIDGWYSIGVGYHVAAGGLGAAAFGSATSASGANSMASGNTTAASGDYSFATGFNTIANRNYMTALGIYNDNTDVNSILDVGIGTSAIDKKTAFKVLSGGETVAPELTEALIDGYSTGRVLTTREWIENNTGDVYKVGTPVDNQIGVWTGDGTIEGTSEFTYDTTSQLLTIGDGTVSPEIRLDQDGVGVGRISFYEDSIASSYIQNDSNGNILISYEGFVGYLAAEGAIKWRWTSTQFGSEASSGARLIQSGGSLTSPIIFRSDDSNSGVGGDGSDAVALISNAKSSLVSSDAGTATNIELFGSVADFGGTTAGEGVLRFNPVTTTPVGTMSSGGLVYVKGIYIYFMDDAGVHTILNDSGTDPTGFELITENTNDGWRLIGRDPSFYGDIGEGALCATHSSGASSTIGATGDYSFTANAFNIASALYSTALGGGSNASSIGAMATGNQTIASGDYSFSANGQCEATGNYASAFGHIAIAEGNYSFAHGHDTLAQNLYQASFGVFNLGTANDTIFEIGVGLGDVSRANGFEVYDNGLLTAPEMTIAMIDAGPDETLTTKEWVEDSIDNRYRQTSSSVPGPTYTWDLSIGESKILVLSGNLTTFNITNIQAGGIYTLILKQDSTGSRTISWPGSVKWPGGTAPTLTTVGNSIDIITFIGESTTTLYGTSNLNFS